MGFPNSSLFILWWFYPININLWQVWFCCWFQPVILKVNINLSYKLILLIFLHFTPITLEQQFAYSALAALRHQGKAMWTSTQEQQCLPVFIWHWVSFRGHLCWMRVVSKTVPAPQSWAQLPSRLRSPITCGSCTSQHQKPSHFPGQWEYRHGALGLVSVNTQYEICNQLQEQRLKTRSLSLFGLDGRAS